MSYLSPIVFIIFLTHPIIPSCTDFIIIKKTETINVLNFSLLQPTNVSITTCIPTAFPTV